LESQIGSGLTGVLYVLDEPSIDCTNATMLDLLETLAGIGAISVIQCSLFEQD